MARFSVIAHFVLTFSVLYSQIEKADSLKCYVCATKKPSSQDHPASSAEVSKDCFKPGAKFLTDSSSGMINPMCGKQSFKDENGNSEVFRFFKDMEDPLLGQNTKYSSCGAFTNGSSADERSCYCNWDACNGVGINSSPVILLYTGIAFLAFRSLLQY